MELDLIVDLTGQGRWRSAQGRPQEEELEINVNGVDGLKCDRDDISEAQS